MFGVENWKIRRKIEARIGFQKRSHLREVFMCLKSVLDLYASALYLLRFSPLHILERTAPVEWVGNGVSSRHDGTVQQIASS